MGEKFYRNTWVEVNLDAIAENVRSFRSHLPAETRIMAVVKADGYGHGAVQVAKEAIAAGATYLGVALIDEAIELRQAGISAPILVLGYTEPEFLEKAVEHNITITVFAKDIMEALIEITNRLSKQAIVHLKLDTGMGRIGVRTLEELESLLAAAQRSSKILVEGLFTHFSCADEEDPAYTDAQHHTFSKVVQSASYAFPIVHCSNSAAGILFPHLGYNMMRLGISLYGQYPSDYTKGKGIDLKPAFSLKSKIAYLKTVPPGTAISYGATYKTSQQSTIATIPIGYADGFSRSLSNRGEALVNGKKVPIIGRVCMDQLMLDVSALPHCQVGDEVVFIGEQQDAQISVDDVAQKLNTINYEVTCMISKRVPRIYKRGGQTVLSKNFLV